MKKYLLVLFVFAPLISYSQIGSDGKTEQITTRNKSDGSKNNTFLYSLSTKTLFGLKYMYCKTWGFYASFKTDAQLLLNDNLATIGVARSAGKRSNLYLGGGLNFGYEEHDDEYNIYSKLPPGAVLESGAVFKMNKITLDIGIGLTVTPYNVYQNWSYSFNETQFSGYLMIGLGFSI